MVCYSPFRASQSAYFDSVVGDYVYSGRPYRRVDPRYGSNPSDVYRNLDLGCGRCIGCTLRRSAHWSVRCYHESLQHSTNSFITLTFDNEHLDSNRSLVKSDFQYFMKRLRINTGVRMRYYHCGEYGSKKGRPHHHACLFGYGFPDRKFWRYSDSGFPMYRSEVLDVAWQHRGLATVNDLTYDSVSYCTGYIVQKVFGRDAEHYYEGRLPEYNTMSRKPGLGRQWIDRYLSDVYPADFVIVDGRKLGVPKYYDSVCKSLFPSLFEEVQSHRESYVLTSPVRSDKELSLLGSFKRSEYDFFDKRGTSDVFV